MRPPTTKQPQGKLKFDRNAVEPELDEENLLDNIEYKESFVKVGSAKPSEKKAVKAEALPTKFDLNNPLLLDMVLDEASFIERSAEFLKPRQSESDIPDEMNVGDDMPQARVTRGTSPVKLKQFADQSLADAMERKSAITISSINQQPKQPTKQANDVKALPDFKGGNRLNSPGNVKDIKKKPIPEWYQQKWLAKDDSEDEDDDRGLFCGVCVSRKKKPQKITTEAPTPKISTEPKKK